jgi:hypothetical protein
MMLSRPVPMNAIQNVKKEPKLSTLWHAIQNGKKEGVQAHVTSSHRQQSPALMASPLPLFVETIRTTGD